MRFGLYTTTGPLHSGPTKWAETTAELHKLKERGVDHVAFAPVLVPAGDFVRRTVDPLASNRFEDWKTLVDSHLVDLDLLGISTAVRPNPAILEQGTVLLPSTEKVPANDLIFRRTSSYPLSHLEYSRKQRLYLGHELHDFASADNIEDANAAFGSAGVGYFGHKGLWMKFGKEVNVATNTASLHIALNSSGDSDYSADSLDGGPGCYSNYVVEFLGKLFERIIGSTCPLLFHYNIRPDTPAARIISVFDAVAYFPKLTPEVFMLRVVDGVGQTVHEFGNNVWEAALEIKEILV